MPIPPGNCIWHVRTGDRCLPISELLAGLWPAHGSQKWRIRCIYNIPANFFWDISVRFLSCEFWDFCRRHDHFRRSPKSSEEVRNLPKTSEVCRRRSYRENAYPQNQRSRGRYCYLFIYTWFSFLTWVWVNIFLEIVSSKTAITHIFQSGVRNWPAGVRSKFSTRRRETHA